jgi:hypothetical protein
MQSFNIFLLAGIVGIGGCSVAADEEEQVVEVEQVGEVREALGVVVPGTRPNINDLTPQQRTSLVNGILAFITQPILDEHTGGHDWHHPANGELFFIRHHDYLNKLEAYLTSNGLGQFVPLPEWDPATRIPSEFLVADPLVTNAAMNANPNRPLPSAFNNLCAFRNARELAVELESFHDGVHGAVGGAMSLVNAAPGAPIFWLWHGFLDDLYHDYEGRCENRKDFNRDVNTDVLWHNGGSGEVSVWWMNGTTVQGNSSLNWQAASSTGWAIKGTGDFNGDGRTDVVWHHADSGQISVWMLEGTNVASAPLFAWTVPASSGWELKGTGDFNRDGHIDLLWHHGGSGQVHVWYLNGMTITGTADLSWNVPASSGWEIKGTGDFNRDGQMDVLWHHPAGGTVGVWLMNGTAVTSNPVFASNVPASSGWALKGTGDYNRDGNIDLLWHHAGSGQVHVWWLNGTTITGNADLSWNVPGTTWQIVSR